METSAPDAPVAPEFVVGPFRLHPFRALSLGAGVAGGPHAARAFSRPYRKVAERLSNWQRQGRTTKDDVPAIYLHEYTAEGVTVRGLVGALDLSRTASRSPDEQQAVFPHEGVHLPQVEELAARMAEMQVNPAPILLVHKGSPQLREIVDAARSAPPHRTCVDRSGQVHRIWRLQDPAELAHLEAVLSPTQALIADGHHRYAAYLQLQRTHPHTAWDRGLVMLVDQRDTPLWLGPIHRVLARADMATVLDVLHRTVGAEIQEASRDEAFAAMDARTLVITDTRRWSTATLPGEQVPVRLLDRHGLPALSAHPLSYHHTAEDALGHAHRHGGVALIMPGPAYDEVVAAAHRGELLPEKATSFQPKPTLGILMRDLHDESPDLP